ncbi:hypothetical protein [Williamsia sp. CHRR-6]|uniref:hypothetical protein n=1 Tax=Williamsia sp. CHRR-6 TaxID=2835871 RepID=UPI001BD9A8DA|nr:hypothetical protein [Williamsia sp. CHRR-6]MBT0567202.1 hypothetical protein [Williamsia sp. CHRR-6]
MNPTGPDDPDRVPSMAELDAMDLAAIAAGRTSADRDSRPEEIGPPPTALHHAYLLWLVSAGAGLVVMILGLLDLGSISDALRIRMESSAPGDPQGTITPEQARSLSETFPPVMLVGIGVVIALQYPLLTAIGRRHSRNVRSFFLALVVITLIAIPVGLDLLFSYDSTSVLAPVLGWTQFGALVLCALFTLRRSVNQWLPEPMKFRP